MLENYIREFVARMMNPGAELEKETICAESVQHLRVKTVSLALGGSKVRYETEVNDTRPDGRGTYLVAIPRTLEEAKSTHEEVVAEIRRTLNI